jgi:hypothetical protein
MSQLAPELDARLTAIEAALAAAEVAHAALVSDVAALDNERAADTAAIIAEIQGTEAEVLLGQQALAAQIAGGVNRKALQLNSSAKTLQIASGIDMDTGGNGAIAPCAIIFGLETPAAGNATVLSNAASFNNRGFDVKINSNKLRFLAATSGSNQRIQTGTATWANGEAHWAAGIWDGTNWTILLDGVVDAVASTNNRSASPGVSPLIKLNDDGDDQDIWDNAFIRGVVTTAQVIALHNKLIAGDYAGAAEDIDAFNSSAGYLVGPTDEDDPTTIVDGIREWVDGRETITTGSPSLIDIPS